MQNSMCIILQGGKPGRYAAGTVNGYELVAVPGAHGDANARFSGIKFTGHHSDQLFVRLAVNGRRMELDGQAVVV